MSMDDYGRGSDKSATEQEGVLFAPTPVWERGRKRSRLGGRKTATPATTVSPEPRSFAERDDDEPMALDRPINRPMTDQTTAYAMGEAAAAPSARVEDEADADLVAPIGRPTPRVDRRAGPRGVAPAAIAAGAVAVVAAGAVGWYATRGNDSVPELASGETTSQVATAPLPPVDMLPAPPVADPAARAVQGAPPPAVEQAAAPPPRQTARVEPRAEAARTRPATAASAESTGVDASTRAALPEAPQPYTSLNPGAAPPPVNPAPVPIAPPVQAAPPAAEPIPSTPPTITPEPSPAPAPTETAPPVEAAPTPPV